MSSTIGKKGVRTRQRTAGADDKQKARKKNAAVRGFGIIRQQEFLRWMMQGASPQIACAKMNLPLSIFWRAVEHDAEFAAQLQQAWDALSFDVVAALYHSAIKGNAQAQQFWLKHRPAPRWMMVADPSIADDLESLPHDELLERIRAEAPDLAIAIAARDLAKRCGGASETVPGAPESPGE